MQYTKNILCVDDKYWTFPTTILKNVLPFPGGRLGAHCLKGIIIFPAITGKFPVGMPLKDSFSYPLKSKVFFLDLC